MAFLTRQQILTARDCGPADLSGLDFDQLDAQWDGMTADEQAAARASSPRKVDAFLARRPKARQIMKAPLNLAGLYEATQDHLARSAREYLARMEAPLNLAGRYEAMQDQLARSARELAHWIGGISIEVKERRAQVLGAAIFDAIKRADAQMLLDLVSDKDFGDAAMRVASARARCDVDEARRELQAATEREGGLREIPKKGGIAKANNSYGPQKRFVREQWEADFNPETGRYSSYKNQSAFCDDMADQIAMRPKLWERQKEGVKPGTIVGWVRNFRRANNTKKM